MGFGSGQRRRAASRVKPGDGRALPQMRWWQLFRRALFHITISDEIGRQLDYSVDVPRKRDQGYDDGKGIAHLYLNGTHAAESKLPAAFPVHGGIIEVAMSMYGIKRCHYVTATGQEQQLTPDPKTAEGRRTRVDHEHPALSRSIGILSVVFLVVGVLLLLLQLAEPISAIPLIAESIGTFQSPIHLPLWLNIGLGIGAWAASTERALRLRNSWLDSAAN